MGTLLLILLAAAPAENCPFPIIPDELPAWSECQVDPLIASLAAPCPLQECAHPCAVEVEFAVPPSKGAGLADQVRAQWNDDGQLVRIERDHLLEMGADGVFDTKFERIFEKGMLAKIELISQVTRQIEVTFYVRDGAGRVNAIERRRELDGRTTTLSVVRYRRDGRGRVIAVEQPGGVVNKVSYDSRGRIATYGRKDWRSRYVWSKQGLLARIEEAAAPVVVFERDREGRVSRIRYPPTKEGSEFVRDNEGRLFEERPISLSPERRIRRYRYGCSDL